jgi:hypothetical protein
LSSEELISRVGALLDRRAFLQKIGQSAVAAVMLLLGMAPATLATYTCLCCHLCQACSTSPCTPCACIWAWTCTSGGKLYRCVECHGDTSYCGSGCSNVVCSQYVWIGDGPDVLTAAT